MPTPFFLMAPNANSVSLLSPLRTDCCWIHMLTSCSSQRPQMPKIIALLPPTGSPQPWLRMPTPILLWCSQILRPLSLLLAANTCSFGFSFPSHCRLA
uniref:Uncharacterized protein n=1 Tax=Arundo donax TaxID=35708 RepID=A0A0A9CEX8_ARUDO